MRNSYKAVVTSSWLFWKRNCFLSLLVLDFSGLWSWRWAARVWTVFEDICGPRVQRGHSLWLSVEPFELLLCLLHQICYTLHQDASCMTPLSLVCGLYRRWVTVRAWVRSPPCCSCLWTRRTPFGPCPSSWPTTNMPCTVSTALWVFLCAGTSPMSDMSHVILDTNQRRKATVHLKTLSPLFPGFFVPGFPKLQRFQTHHDQVLSKLLPKLKKHLVGYTHHTWKTTTPCTCDVWAVESTNVCVWMCAGPGADVCRDLLHQMVHAVFHWAGENSSDAHVFIQTVLFYLSCVLWKLFIPTLLVIHCT